jgi:peptidoglycan-N-acetylglucosamine deacetylase
MTALKLHLIAIVLPLSLPLALPARAADCPRADALGTSRTVVVDAKDYPRVGTKSFPDSLPLADKEVVLTFDDGPLPSTTTRILSALSAECVQATFFVVGRNAQAYPNLIKNEARAGHSLGNHTFTHPMLDHIGETQALAEIDKGFAADDAALGSLKPAAARFFRFPYFASTPALLDAMQARGIVVFGADLGKRLAANDTRAGIGAADPAPLAGRQGHHPSSRHQARDGGDAAELPAIPQAQRLQDRPYRPGLAFGSRARPICTPLTGSCSLTPHSYGAANCSAPNLRTADS